MLSIVSRLFFIYVCTYVSTVSTDFIRSSTTPNITFPKVNGSIFLNNEDNPYRTEASLMVEAKGGVSETNSEIILVDAGMGVRRYGLSADNAEKACQNLVKIETYIDIPSHEIFPQYKGSRQRRLFKIRNNLIVQKNDNQIKGHLLSFRSKSELNSMIRRLRRRNRGIYWTGARIIRKNVDMSLFKSKDYGIEVHWSDGRKGSVDILGLTPFDVMLLEIGKEYCLALDLRFGRWHARHCSNILPYACNFDHERLQTPAVTTSQYTTVKPITAPRITTIIQRSSTIAYKIVTNSPIKETKVNTNV